MIIGEGIGEMGKVRGMSDGKDQGDQEDGKGGDALLTVTVGH